jgi:hypothetical protein
MTCIFCGSNGKLSREHIIPESIGGSVILNNVCIDCNSRFGSEIDSELTKNYHIYNSYKELAKKFALDFEFSFKDAYFETPDGIKIKAAKKSSKKRTLITKTDPDIFIIDNDDNKFIPQYISKKGKEKKLSDSVIKKAFNNYNTWNRTKQIGNEYHDDLFEFSITLNEKEATFHYIMEADTPHRYLAKACVEFANLFNISDKINNIHILKSHAMNGDQLQNIVFFQEVHKEVKSRPCHYIIFTETQFVIGIFCQFIFALEIKWNGKPQNLVFANNMLTKKLVYCNLINGKMNLTDREYLQ